MITKTTSTTAEGKTITVNTSDTTQPWRMVYRDTKVLYCFESTGITSTIDNLFTADTKAECITEATRLNLTGIDTALSGSSGNTKPNRNK